MTLIALLNACPIARAARGGHDIRPRHCVWCDAPLSGRQRRWCSDRCVHAHRSNHTWSVARAAALDRDGHRCVRCGRQPANGDAPWQAADEPLELFQARVRQWHAEHPPLEVNHRTPCRGQHSALSCAHHLDGLETLCRPCHAAETARQFQTRTDPPGQGRLWDAEVVA